MTDRLIEGRYLLRSRRLRREARTGARIPTVGTVAYLAPEVANGNEPTAAPDVFSLGAVLYTALEGHSPFGMARIR